MQFQYLKFYHVNFSKNQSDYLFFKHFFKDMLFHTLIHSLIRHIQVVLQIFNLQGRPMPVFDNINTNSSQKGSQTTLDQSTEQINFQLTEQESYFRLKVIERVFTMSRQLKLAKDTTYLAVAYLDALLTSKLSKQMLQVELVALGLIFVTSKINEISYPSANSLSRISTRYISLQELVMIQSTLIERLSYDMYSVETIYSQLCSILYQNGQFYSIDLYQYDLQQYIKKQMIIGQSARDIALGIVYLNKPSILRKMGISNTKEIRLTIDEIGCYQNIFESLR